MTLSSRRLGPALTVALLVMGLTLVAAASPAAAACVTPQGNNCFLGGQVRNSSSSVNVDADGAYAQIYTIGKMNVPFSGGGSGVMVPTGQSVTGFSVRALQVGDPYGSGQFIAAGYTAGCGAPPDNGSNNGCTGQNASRGVFKKVYIDGVQCTPTCSYFLTFHQAISVGETHSYQIQRNQLGTGSSGYAYRVFVDGVQVGSNRPGVTFARGFVNVIAERLFRDSAGRQVNLNMTEDYFRAVSFHRFGSASSSPPGTSNYTASSSFGFVNHFSGCSVSASATQLSSQGTC